MVSTRKQRQSIRKFFSQLDDSNRDIIIGNAVSDREENVVIDEGTVDQDFTVNNFGSNSAANKNLVNVKTLERCFDEKIDRAIDNIVGKVEDRIQIAILTAIDSIDTPKIDLAVR